MLLLMIYRDKHLVGFKASTDLGWGFSRKSRGVYNCSRKPHFNMVFQVE